MTPIRINLRDIGRTVANLLRSKSNSTAEPNEIGDSYADSSTNISPAPPPFTSGAQPANLGDTRRCLGEETNDDIDVNAARLCGEAIRKPQLIGSTVTQEWKDEKNESTDESTQPLINADEEVSRKAPRVETPDETNQLVDPHPSKDGNSVTQLTNPKQAIIVIVNFIPPYDRELAGIIGAPSGAKFRFRYQRLYVEPSQLDLSPLIGTTVLVCMRNRNTGDIIPMRIGSLMSWRWRAGVAVFDVSLTNLAILRKDSNGLRHEHRVKFLQDLETDLRGFDTSGGQDLEKLVFLSGAMSHTINAAENSLEPEDSRWSLLLEEIDSQFPDLDLDFIKIVGLSDNEGRLLEISSPKPNERGFRIEPGRQYSLEVAQRTYTGRKGNSSVASKREIMLHTPTEDLQIPVRSIPIHGKYSDIEFFFAVKKGATPGPRHASVDVIKESDTPSYGCEIPIYIHNDRSTKILQVISPLGIVAGFLFYIFPDFIADLLTVVGAGWSQVPHPSIESLEKIGVVTMMISSLGNPVTRWLNARVNFG